MFKCKNAAVFGKTRSKTVGFINYCKNRKYLLALISGLTASLTLTFPFLFPVTWISLIPLVYSLFIYGKTVRQCFKIMLIYGISFYLVLYTWFFSFQFDWDGVNILKRIFYETLVWLGISVVQTFQISLAGIIYGIIKPSKSLSVITFPFIYIFVEWLQELTRLGMPWGRLAISQYLFLPAVQSASLLGILFVDFLIVTVNCLIACALTQTEKEKHSARKILYIAALSVFALNAIFGGIRMLFINNTDYQNTVKAAAIQGNFPSGSKWDNGGANAFKRFMELSQEAANAGAKIIVWPETAVPVDISEGNFYDNAYANFAQDNGVYLIAGGFYEDGEGNNYSALVMYPPQGESGIEERLFLKRQLVPFGEYIPFRSFIEENLPFLSEFTSLDTDLTPSEGSKLIETEYGKISGLICFDSIFPSFSYTDTRNGSQLILMGTNDSYYDNSANPYQHKAQAILRAIENNRFFIRAANTGISSIITPSGVCSEIGEAGETCCVVSGVSFISNNTLYALAGDVIVYIAAAFMAVMFIKFRLLKNTASN